MRLNIQRLLAVSTLSLLSAGFGANAQTAKPVVPVTSATPPEQEISVVTVLGRLPKRVSSTVRRMSTSSATSCAYTPGSNDEFMDSYLDSFHGKGRSNDGTEAAPTVEGETGARRSFDDNSTYGDAGNTAPRQGPDADGREDPCSQSDYNAAGGRNYIARKDKTLDQAYTAYDSGNFAKALEIFKQSYSKVGYDEAALMIGNIYLYGQGTKRDTKQAIEWYSKLATARYNKEQNVVYNPKEPEFATPRAEALSKLALIHMAGIDSPKDPKKAREAYKTADGLNYIPARFAYARMLQSGYGGDKDTGKAVKLYLDAAEHGYAPAQYALANLYRYGSVVPKNAESSFAWFQQSAFNPTPDGKKPYAQFALAQMYDSGEGTKADPVKALALFKLAAVSGHPGAQNALATYFYEGQLVKKDLAVGRKLFLAAASQGQPESMVNLAVMMFKGEGGEKDVTQAYVWLRLAHKMGHEPAAPMVKVLEKQLTAEQRAKAETVLAPKPAG